MPQDEWDAIFKEKTPENFDFFKYSIEFEKRVIIEGLKQGLFGKEVQVPLKPNKLYTSPLAKKIGTRFNYDRPAVIEYYGVQKRSFGFMEAAVNRNYMPTILAVVVHFNAIKNEHIVQLAPDLLPYFPFFKQEIVKIRFPKE
jgi:hypothetical protein